ncbi:hypothetical protein D4764_04G0014510 [Takifugu flavidus]|uniref:Uncharacterized protein n=1 Tax=Takifugu flavidus TaxID=433684 RepID=A0A5C6N5Q7_9TELE|nr:hypothetical protein D4764_04G0014510 [Takifugu flavidus]
MTIGGDPTGRGSHVASSGCAWPDSMGRGPATRRSSTCPTPRPGSRRGPRLGVAGRFLRPLQVTPPAARQLIRSSCIYLRLVLPPAARLSRKHRMNSYSGPSGVDLEHLSQGLGLHGDGPEGPSSIESSQL